jgi:hypothetical protein
MTIETETIGAKAIGIEPGVRSIVFSEARWSEPWEATKRLKT